MRITCKKCLAVVDQTQVRLQLQPTPEGIGHFVYVCLPCCQKAGVMSDAHQAANEET